MALIAAARAGRRPSNLVWEGYCEPCRKALEGIERRYADMGPPR